MSYSKINLEDVKDLAAAHGVGDVQEARFPAGDLGVEQTGFNYFKVKPGKREAFAHRHENAEEVVVVLEGAGRMKIDDEIVEIGPKDCLRIAPGTARQTEAGPEGLTLLVFGARHEGDGEIIAAEEFWAD